MTRDISVGPVRRERRGQVQSYVRLTASTYIHCCTYDDAAPILAIQDGAADITITNPGRGEVTEEDVTVRPPAGRGRDPVRGRAGQARRQEPRCTADPDGVPGRRRDGRRRWRRGGWSWYLRPPLGSLPCARKR